MTNTLALADVVVCRAGAGTIAELTALGKPAVLTPVPSSAGDEQTRPLAEAGTAITVSGTATGERVGAAISELLNNWDSRARLGKAVRDLGRPDAGSDWAGLVRIAAAGASVR